MYCNHVWGNNYPTNLEKLVLVQKKLVRIITNSPFRAHSEPLLYANKMLTVTDVNEYVVGMFMNQWVNGTLPQIFRTSTNTGEIVMNMAHEMLMTFMYCMEDSTFGDLV